MLESKKNCWNSLISKCKDFENSLPADFRKRTGSYFTNFETALSMCFDLIESFRKKYGKEDLIGKTFLEPCGGAGNFVYCYLYEISKLEFSQEKIKKIIEKIYYCDSNQKAADFYKENFTQFCKIFFDIDLTENYFSSHIGSSLLFDVNDENPKYISLQSIFPNLENADIIITNPPYKKIKTLQIARRIYPRQRDLFKNKKTGGRIPEIFL